MKRKIKFIFILLMLVIQVLPAVAQQRFPKPEFESGHTQPQTITPEPRAEWLEYLDVFLLVASLSVMTWFVLKKRSRKGVFWTALLAVVYFGFIRQGCICSVGSLQNVVLALFNPGYKIPLTALAFFVIPLIFTLFFGRTFCAGICPLGAIQDFFVFRPVSLKSWFLALLGIIPYIYLGLAVLYAATATDFIICRYDPFIGIFRFDGTFMMYMIGGIFLLTSVFIARPYCRFFCPYGVLLNLISRVSRKHLTITPTQCIQCRLCEDSCPFGAIEKPSEVKVKDIPNYEVKRFIVLSLIIPVLILLGIWTGARFHENLARVNKTVQLAEVLMDNDPLVTEEQKIEIDAFRSIGTSIEELYAEAADIVHDFYIGGMILGGFIGLVFGLTLAGISTFRYREDYEPNKGTCLSCARCLDYCPVKPGDELSGMNHLEI